MSLFYQHTRDMLRDLALPTDEENISESGMTFADGGHFRIEVPTINSVDAARGVVEGCESRGHRIDRLTETRGLFRHTSAEISDYASLAADHGIEIVMSIGPRATYDIGASAQTREGSRIGYRLRGPEQLVRAIEDVRRAMSLGISSFVVYDEGLLAVLAQLREAGHLDPSMRLKVSAHCGHANPASARLLEQLGANSFNPIRDLTLPMLAALRRTVSIPLDIHLDNPSSSGGFVRNYEGPDIVRCCSPVHLKVGNGALGEHGTLPSPAQISQIVDQVDIILEIIATHFPESRQSPGATNLATKTRSA